MWFAVLEFIIADKPCETLLIIIIVMPHCKTHETQYTVITVRHPHLNVHVETILNQLFNILVL